MTAEIALSLINKVIDIQKNYPEMTKNVDGLQQKILEIMKEIRKELDVLNERERDIFTVSIINFIHEKAEESLLE
jgi:peptidoglycan hydrolase CwlO-like protein